MSRACYLSNHRTETRENIYNLLFFIDYLRQQQPGGLPPRSGYEELDTTLMPPRPGAGVPGAAQGAELYNRASPAPGSEAGLNPGYAGRERLTLLDDKTTIVCIIIGLYLNLNLLHSFIYFVYLCFYLFSPGYPAPSPSHSGLAMGGRVSVASESYHYPDQGHHGLYGQHGDPGLMAAHPGHMNYSSNYDNGNNYGQFYHDPNMTANSVFEDQGQDQGLLTPLPGTLGQGAAPRAVFDEDQEPEPAPAMFSRQQQAAPTQSDQQPGLCLLRFAYHSITLNS